MKNQESFQEGYHKILFYLPIIILISSGFWIKSLFHFFFVIGICLSALIVNYVCVNRSKLARIKLFCFGFEWLAVMVFLLLSGNSIIHLSPCWSLIILLGYLASTVGVTYWLYSVYDCMPKPGRWSVIDKIFDERVVPFKQSSNSKSKWQWLVGAPSIAIGLMIQRNIPAEFQARTFFICAILLACVPMILAAALIANGLVTIRLEKKHGIDFLDRTLLELTPEKSGKTITH